MNNEFVFQSQSLEDTDRLGAMLANVFQPGTTVALNGTLGAGKTRLVQAIGAAMGLSHDEIVSPTFVLCQHYEGDKTLHHFDAYRIADDDEFLELGPDEYFDSDGITFVEWADRVQGCMPKNCVTIEIEVTGENARQFTIRGEVTKHLKE